MRCKSPRLLLGTITAASVISATVLAAESPLPDAKPVPDVQVLPLPYDQASFQHLGQELTRYHFGEELRRPFWYPIMGPAGRSLTRMNMPSDPGRSLTRDAQPKDPNKPEDPLGHSHQNSVWISRKNVDGIDFWRDGGPIAGQIVHQQCREGLKYYDGESAASLLSLNHWNDPQGKTLMIERRCATVDSCGDGSWRLIIDLQFEVPHEGRGEVTLGKTAFGPIGVRMAKTMGVNDGGGRILNSSGQRNEAEVFRKPARWVDYSGPVTRDETAGITLMDHPQNPGHPTAFHVRDNGWMGVSPTLNHSISITSDLTWMTEEQLLNTKGLKAVAVEVDPGDAILFPRGSRGLARTSLRGSLRHEQDAAAQLPKVVVAVSRRHDVHFRLPLDRPGGSPVGKTRSNRSLPAANAVGCETVRQRAGRVRIPADHGHDSHGVAGSGRVSAASTRCVRRRRNDRHSSARTTQAANGAGQAPRFVQTRLSGCPAAENAGSVPRA